MTRYTEDYFRNIAGGLTEAAAETRLRTAAKSATGVFDIFLSHSVRDARVILGVRNWLSAKNYRVYVDWIDDPQMDRSRVCPSTAARLRKQMQNSHSLIYATSRAARESRWMPWELGYFDGRKGGDAVSILPIESRSSNDFTGEEYLGLYKLIEQRETVNGPQPYAVLPGRERAESLRSFVAATNR